MNEHVVPFTGELTGPLLGLGVSLGIGLLIGLEREYAQRVVEKEEQFAGVRTYPLMALLGYIAALLSAHAGAWVLPVAFAGLFALVTATYVKSARAGSYGITTELSGILTFLLGVLVFNGQVLLAVVIAVVITALLSLKLPLHRFITTLTAEEVRAIIQFVIIAAVVLPFLPEKHFGPDGIWDLHDIWMMVVLVSGISLVGYLLAKVLGPRKGILLTGLLGGMVSSTAVTLGLARRRHAHPSADATATAVGIIAASAVLYPRILLETWVVGRGAAGVLIVPAAFITAVALLAAFLIHRRNGKDAVAEVPLENPLNFRAALLFAVAYMAVQWLIALASEHYGPQGLYASGLVFGATDMDAITLSVARKALVPQEAVTAILLATLSNTVLKYLIVLVVGDRALRRPVGIGFAAIFLAGLIGIALVRWT